MVDCGISGWIPENSPVQNLIRRWVFDSLVYIYIYMYIRTYIYTYGYIYIYMDIHMRII